MNKIIFNERVKQQVMELAKQINNLQTQLRAICQTVANINNQDPSEYALAPDFSGIVKIKKDSCTDEPNSQEGG